MSKQLPRWSSMSGLPKDIRSTVKMVRAEILDGKGTVYLECHLRELAKPRGVLDHDAIAELLP